MLFTLYIYLYIHIYIILYIRPIINDNWPTVSSETHIAQILVN